MVSISAMTYFLFKNSDNGLMKVSIVSLGFKRTPKENEGHITDMILLLRDCNMDTPTSQKAKKANVWILHFQDYCWNILEYFDHGSGKVTSYLV